VPPVVSGESVEIQLDHPVNQRNVVAALRVFYRRGDGQFFPIGQAVLDEESSQPTVEQISNA